MSGLVTLDGRPLAIEEGMRGTVIFQPTGEEGVTLSGMIDAKGKYQLSMGSTVVVVPGDYVVKVFAVEVVPAGKDRPEPSGIRITPARYASAAESGLQCEVVPGPNQVDLNLTSDDEEISDEKAESDVEAPKKSEDQKQPQGEPGEV